jgi:hypothetical protein
MRKRLTLTASILLLLLLITGCSQTGTYKDPVIKRADIVYDENTGLVPYVVNADGVLIASFGTGGGDLQPEQGTKFVRSLDNGETWSKPFMTIRSESNLIGSHSMLYNLPPGNWSSNRLLLCTIEATWRRENPKLSDPDWLSLTADRKFDTYYSISNDGGKTFSQRKLISDPEKRNDFPQGPIVELPNGDLLWSWGYWGSNPLNGFRRSVDGGVSWSKVERAFKDPPTSYDKPFAFNETGVAVCKDGSIVAVARVDGALDNDKRFWMVKSFDNGHTWTEPRQIEIVGGSPALYCTPQGQLWLAYRDGGFGPGLGLAVSDDNGDTWRFLYHLKDPKGEHERLYGHIRYTDEDRKKPWRPAEGMVGYPCFAELTNNLVYVVYHNYSREEMAARLPDCESPFYIAGNLLEIPKY